MGYLLGERRVSVNIGYYRIVCMVVLCVLYILLVYILILNSLVRQYGRKLERLRGYASAPPLERHRWILPDLRCQWWRWRRCSISSFFSLLSFVVAEQKAKAKKHETPIVTIYIPNLMILVLIGINFDSYLRLFRYLAGKRNNFAKKKKSENKKLVSFNQHVLIKMWNWIMPMVNTKTMHITIAYIYGWYNF